MLWGVQLPALERRASLGWACRLSAPCQARRAVNATGARGGFGGSGRAAATLAPSAAQGRRIPFREPNVSPARPLSGFRVTAFCPRASGRLGWTERKRAGHEECHTSGTGHSAFTNFLGPTLSLNQRVAMVGVVFDQYSYLKLYFFQDLDLIKIQKIIKCEIITSGA
jgi:hypothetical protein